MRCLKRIQHVLLFLGVFLGPAAALADVVEIRLSSSVVGAAEYRSGKPGRPAVLLLHGFLQTRNAPPMNRLADALFDDGYTVLVPTLSLGVSRRNKSLSCEAVHAHTQQNDLREIALWVNWLVAHGHQRIAMIGHSSGAKDVLAYLAGTPDSRVERAILVALVPLGVDGAQYLKTRAEKPAVPGQTPPLRRFSMAYCNNNYVATVPSYLSYADWTGDRILSVLDRVSVPTDIVLGTKDQVVEPRWPARLAKSRTSLIMVENAGHFFDGEFEFELNDRVNDILKKNFR